LGDKKFEHIVTPDTGVIKNGGFAHGDFSGTTFLFQWRREGNFLYDHMAMNRHIKKQFEGRSMKKTEYYEDFDREFFELFSP
jgi:hypothetical protein